MASQKFETAEKRTISIWNLPLPLREDIYDYIFRSAHIKVHARPRSHDTHPAWCYAFDYKDRTVPCPTLAIAQTHSMLRAEALPRFYKHCMFHLYWGREEFGEVLEMPGVPPLANQPTHESTNAVDPACERHLEAVRDAIRRIQRLGVDIQVFPDIGFNMTTFIWSTPLHEKFPRVRELDISVDMPACSCSYDPIIKRWLMRASGYTIWNIEHPDVSDGTVMQKIVQNSPDDWRMRFEVNIWDQCAIMDESTTIELLCDGETTFTLLDWVNVDTCNELLVQIVEQYGLEQTARDMQKMIDDNFSSRIP